MTITNVLLQKYEKNFKTKEQEQLFLDCAKRLEKYFDKATQREYKNKPAFFIPIKDIDVEQFQSLYQYWLYDSVSELLFVNIHSLHPEFRRCLIMLSAIADGWIGSLDILDDDVADIESVYTAIDLGFYASGAFNMSYKPSSLVVAADHFKREDYSFLNRFMIQDIGFSKEEGIQHFNQMLNKYSTKNRKA